MHMYENIKAITGRALVHEARIAMHFATRCMQLTQLDASQYLHLAFMDLLVEISRLKSRIMHEA